MGNIYGSQLDRTDGAITADTDLLKMVPVETLLGFGNYFHTL